MGSELKSEVLEGVALLKERFGPACVLVTPDTQGGAFVEIENVPLGAPFSQASTWMGFQLTAMFPYADVYPHFVRADLSRVDGATLGEGISIGQFRDKQALQLSRRSKHIEPRVEMVLQKLLRVLTWLHRK